MRIHSSMRIFLLLNQINGLSMFADLEYELALYFERKHCILVGSGTTALYCAFQTLNQKHNHKNPAILFPNITCETAVNAAIFAGFIPRFCDVQSKDYVMCADSVKQELDSGNIIGIVPTHIFGHLADVPAIENIISESMLVIEDAAQGYGGVLRQRQAGGMGQVSIISFGDGKLLDCGGGGALLCDDTEFATQCRETAAMLSDDTRNSTLHRQQVMKEMMTARKQFRDDRAGLIRCQRNILQKHRNGYLTSCRSKWADSIQKSLPELDTIIKSRENLMKQLDEILKNRESVTLPSRKGTPALWRYSFLIDRDTRKYKIKALKKEGLVVSKLFKPCTDKFSENVQILPVSESISESIVNLQIPRSYKKNDEILSAVKKVFS